jgi:hypothetical protein
LVATTKACKIQQGWEYKLAGCCARSTNRRNAKLVFPAFFAPARKAGTLIDSIELLKEVKSLGRSTTTLLPFIQMFRRNAGVLLSQVAYWYLAPDKTGKSKLRVQRGGHMWAVKTAVHWQAESGLTRYQYKDGLKILKDAGVLVVESHLFTFPTGVTKATWIRVDQEALARAVTEHAGRVELEAAQAIAKAGNRPIEKPVSGLSSGKQGSTAGKDVASSDAGPRATRDSGKPVNTTPETLGDEYDENTLIKESVTCDTAQTVTKNPVKVVSTAFNDKAGDTIMPTAQEQLENHALKQAKLRAEDKGSRLYPRWRAHMAELYPDVEPTLTVKGKAQLCAFAKSVGYDKSIETLDFAFAHWYDVRAYVKERKGDFIKATEPDPGMLLKYFQPVLQLIADRKKQAAPPRSPNTVKPDKLPVVKVQPVPAAPAEPLPSTQEIEDMWATSLAVVKHKG